MRAKATATVFVALCVVMLFTETSSFWRRRRRRRRRPPPPVNPCAGSRDCLVSSWSGWGSCSWPCGDSGVMARSRYITSTAINCGSCPYPLRETRSCNREAWRCRNGGTRASRGCNCRPGWTGTCCRSGESTVSKLKAL